jgi:UDP-glucose 4-epimerase
MRNILVTGGAGFIGHHLVKKLIEKNCRIEIIDNLSNGNKDFLYELRLDTHNHEDIVIHNEDIRNEEALSNIFKHKEIDTCIHLAAKTSVQESAARPVETIDVNVRGTAAVLEACSKYNVRNFVFASSAAVYGQPRKLPVSEDLIPEPISPYGASKVAGEALVTCYRLKMKNCQSLRFFNVYGEGQTSAYAGVIIKFIERLSN